MRIVLCSLVCSAALLAGCGGGGVESEEDSGAEPTADTGRDPDALAADLLGPNEYETTIECSGAKQGIYPKAIGTLTNKSKQDTLFHVYVAWTRAGEPVDLGVTYTKTVDSGETGPWETFTTVQDADGCEVVCVDRQHPTDPNRAENCQAYDDKL